MPRIIFAGNLRAVEQLIVERSHSTPHHVSIVSYGGVSGSKDIAVIVSSHRGSSVGSANVDNVSVVDVSVPLSIVALASRLNHIAEFNNSESPYSIAESAVDVVELVSSIARSFSVLLATQPVVSIVLMYMHTNGACRFFMISPVGFLPNLNHVYGIT